MYTFKVECEIAKGTLKCQATEIEALQAHHLQSEGPVSFGVKSKGRADTVNQVKHNILRGMEPRQVP